MTEVQNLLRDLYVLLDKGSSYEVRWWPHAPYWATAMVSATRQDGIVIDFFEDGGSVSVWIGNKYNGYFDSETAVMLLQEVEEWISRLQRKRSWWTRFKLFFGQGHESGR